MTIIDLYSKRQRKLKGEISDVFQYTKIPIELRNQIIHIWLDAFGDITYGSKAIDAYFFVYRTLCREYGVMSLPNGTSINNNPLENLSNYFMKCTDYEKILDVIELSFQYINVGCRKFDYIQSSNPKIDADDAIAELNQRFLEHNVGYRFESSQIIRMDSKYVHENVIKPALHLLSHPEFKGANDEFLKAHEHYRNKNYKECINECLKALESTLKIICKLKKWPYKETDQAKTLIGYCFEHELIPQFLQSEFTSLRALLESGVPTTRNRTSGHGQGAEVQDVPQYMASYILNTAGSSILFLVSAAITK